MTQKDAARDQRAASGAAIGNLAHWENTTAAAGRDALVDSLDHATQMLCLRIAWFTREWADRLSDLELADQRNVAAGALASIVDELPAELVAIQLARVEALDAAVEGRHWVRLARRPASVGNGLFEYRAGKVVGR